MTDVLAPKEVYLVAASPGCDPSVMTSVVGQLEGISFEAGFTSEQVKSYCMTGRPGCVWRAKQVAAMYSKDRLMILLPQALPEHLRGLFSGATKISARL